MSILTIRLPDDKHERLKALAKQRRMSVNKLIEELSTQALAEFDMENRFRALAARGSREEGVALLEKLDAHFSKRSDSRRDPDCRCRAWSPVRMRPFTRGSE